MRTATSLMLAVWILTGAAAAAGQDAASSGTPPTAPAKPLGMPHWVRKPDGDDVASVYPSGALGRGGHAVVLCKITADGSMSDCKLLSEQPEGLGFGDAALKLAPHFKMSATTSDGRSVEGLTVNVPMTFSPP